MQVVILCGGKGVRIRDVSSDVPKPMIKIGDRPILWHIMKLYASHGFDQFVLCLGHLGWVTKRFFLDYAYAGADLTISTKHPGGCQVHPASEFDDWEVTLAETGADSMTGCRIKRIEKYISGDLFMLTYGDGLADVNIGELVRFHKSHGKIGTVTVVHPPGPERFGEVELDGRRVSAFKEKPLATTKWINGGFFVFDRRLFDLLEDDPSLVFEHGPLTRLCAEGELVAYRHKGFWHCMDNIRDHEFLSTLWKDGNAPWKASNVMPYRKVA